MSKWEVDEWVIFLCALAFAVFIMCIGVAFVLDVGFKVGQ